VVDRNCPARTRAHHGGERIAVPRPPARQSSPTASRWLIAAMAAMKILFLGYVLASALNARAVFHVERLDFEYFACVP
jgi:hypothetical protein